MKVSIIGSGFAGLSAAAYLAKLGHNVEVFEKNAQAGGRARMMTKEGFNFDMGPSWYWMPEVFQQFFADHGEDVKDHYDLVRLDPSYQVVFDDQIVSVPANFEETVELFDTFEENGGTKLRKFIRDAEEKYHAAMQGAVMLPGLSPFELLKPNIVKSATKLTLTQSFSKYVRKRFTSKKAIQLLEFPILFLGPTPKTIPALYSMLNYADLKLGTWYPMGGMGKIIDGMVSVLEKYGIEIHKNSPVTGVDIQGNHLNGLVVNDSVQTSDVILGGADYHHIETNILPKEFSQYSQKYWDARELAPSALLIYLGVEGGAEGLLHHNLFFDAPFDAHLKTINETKEWPENPLFYVCNPSKTDDSVAPEGHENLFVLIPTAPGLLDSDENLNEKYLDIVLDRIKSKFDLDLKPRIRYKEFFAPKRFVEDYNAFKGNAYGLANTLMQTHYFKPRMKHNKIDNLYYTGQLTVPGPGVPPSILSGQIAADLINKRSI